jgi:hypothetical protein
LKGGDFLDITTIITICLSLITTITSIVVAILTYKNLKELKLARIEESRAYIVFYIDKHRTDFFHNLIIKNFGKSAGKLISITVSPNLDPTKTEIKFKDSTLADSKNIYLAPGQFLKSAFDFRNYPDKKFNVTVKYESMNKIYTDNYDLNLEYSSNIVSSSPTIKDETHALTQLIKVS